LKAALVLVPQGSIAKDDAAVRAARACGAGIAEIYWDENQVALYIGERGCLESREHWDTETPEGDGIALILHTSGTTSRPKIVPIDS
jgi:long-subunit acyl-CoA synthetase (AMP-forming)